MTNIVQNLIKYGRSIDVVLGIRTRDRRMVGADESIEYGRPDSEGNVNSTSVHFKGFK